MRTKWRSQRRKKAAGTVQEEGANSSRSIKVKVKTRWGVKLGAPRRLWAPNRRGASPENPKLISGDAPRRLGAHNRRGTYPILPSFSISVTKSP